MWVNSTIIRIAMHMLYDLPFSFGKWLNKMCHFAQRFHGDKTCINKIIKWLAKANAFCKINELMYLSVR